jgi:signal transduction histidine kinase
MLANFPGRTAIRTTLHLIADLVPLTSDQRIALFRICQESLTNVARHSGAEEAIISLSWKDDTLRLTIEDDGRGFDVQSHSGRPSLGLLGMQERARLIGAHHSVVSRPNAGTTVDVSLFVSRNQVQEVG